MLPTKGNLLLQYVKEKCAAIKLYVCGYRFDHWCLWRTARPAGASQRGHGGKRTTADQQSFACVKTSANCKKKKKRWWWGGGKGGVVGLNFVTTKPENSSKMAIVFNLLYLKSISVR